MKFGDNLYERSVPQWSFYNVDYNGLKDLIKTRTSNPPTEPVFIPGQGPSSDTWHSLEEELLPVLRLEHDKAGAFIRSKHGEIERRLVDLAKRVEALQQSTAATSRTRVQQSRRYQKLAEDADYLSEDIQALARFANTQRQAFRKILKKYEKWTHSTGLNLRVQEELFKPLADPLRPDLTPYLNRLSEVSTVIKQIPKSLASQQTKPPGESQDKQEASASLLHDAFQYSSAVDQAAAFASVPLGKSAGRATYWIHPDNLDEARVLLLRHMRQCQPAKNLLSRTTSNLSDGQRSGNTTPTTSSSQGERQNVVLFDNLDRFAREKSAATIGSSETTEGHVPTRIALSGWWTNAPDACVLMSDLSPAAIPSKTQRLSIRRKDLSSALSRDVIRSKKTVLSSATMLTQEYLTQHRDVKPLAQIQSTKSLFAGTTNSADVGTWSTLETDVLMSTVDSSMIGQSWLNSGEAFPHAVLEIRWEFSRTPEVVRAFDTSHIAERVRGFSLEAHTIFRICKPDIPQPFWVPLLDKDIRKVPLPSARHGKRRARGDGVNASGSSAVITSGPSSTEGPSDSVFSLTAGPSSATSANAPSLSSPDLSSGQTPNFDEPPKRKKTQRLKELVGQQPKRYWNEFDDGSDFEDTSYAIYVNADEPMTFPGAETVSKAFSAMYQSISKGKQRVYSMLSLELKKDDKTNNERQPLLRGQGSSDQDLEDSSDSDVGRVGRRNSKHRGATSLPAKRNVSASTPYSGRPLSARRQAREATLCRSYVGLLVLSYILLLMSAILRATGRRKAVLEVDAGVISGVIAAEACGVIAIGLLCMRKGRTVTLLHKLAVGLAFAVVVFVGVVLMVSVAIGRDG